MSKQIAEEAATGSSAPTTSAPTPAVQPIIKKVVFEPHLLGPVSNTEEMNKQMLQFQNKKLAERIEQRRQVEKELQKRIQQLEKRQTQDDAILNVVNRYWNQLNEDIRVLLQRFDAEIADETEHQNENAVTTAFLMQLSSWNETELDNELAKRVQVSKRAVAKMVQVIDRVIQRQEKLTEVLANSCRGMRSVSATGEGVEEPVATANSDAAAVLDVLKQTHIAIMAENSCLQKQSTELHAKFHDMSLKVKLYEDNVSNKETANAELRQKIEGLQYDKENLFGYRNKLEFRLAEVLEKLKFYYDAHGEEILNKRADAGNANVSSEQVMDLQNELENVRELANNRKQELEQQYAIYAKTLQEKEQLQIDMSILPVSAIVETAEYKCLQSQFSVLYNEYTKILDMLTEVRVQQLNSTQAFRQRIEQMELDELNAQKKLRTELIEQQDRMTMLRQECESLAVKFSQAQAYEHNAKPLISEMRQLIGSINTHNKQLKADKQRYKGKYEAKCQELHKYMEKDQLEKDGQADDEEQHNGSRNGDLNANSNSVKEEGMGVDEELKEAIAVDEELEKAIDVNEELEMAIAVDEKLEKLEELRSQNQDKKRKLAEDETISNIELEKQQSTQTLPPKCSFLGSHEEAIMLNEMEVTGQAFEEAQEQVARLLQQLCDKDVVNFKLMTERMQLKQLLDLLKEENQELVLQQHDYMSEIQALHAIRQQLEEKEFNMTLLLENMEKQTILHQQAMEIHKRKAIDSAQAANNLEVHLVKCKLQIKELQQNVLEKTGTLANETYKFERLQEELAQLKRSENMKMSGTSNNKELEVYREQLICPSCKVNTKNAVLMKCMHVFCYDCLRKLCETRNRRCPKCNSAFGAKDYKHLYLT